MTPTQSIIHQLVKEFAVFDQQVFDGTVQFMKERFAALQIAKTTYAHLSHNAFQYYPHLFEAASGKTNYQLIQYGVTERVIDIIRKSEKTKVDKRNTKIAIKLTESNITKINSVDIAFSYNGFNGVYDVDTDKGSKKIIIETILAWGDVYAPHYRVLVKVK